VRTIKDTESSADQIKNSALFSWPVASTAKDHSDGNADAPSRNREASVEGFLAGLLGSSGCMDELKVPSRAI